MAEDQQLRTGLARIETLIHQAENLPDPKLRDQVQELVAHLLDFHGAALGRMVEQVAKLGPPGRRVLDAWLDDELIASMLVLYDLHPDGLESRVREALDSVRPYLRSHGGNVELVSIADGIVHLRMQGKCNGCPSSEATARLTIEGAIYARAPDVAGIEVEGIAAPRVGTAFVPLEQLGAVK